jgi:hypothetical protein
MSIDTTTPVRTRRTPVRIAALLGAVLAGATALGVGQTAMADAKTSPDATVHAKGGLVSHITASRYGPRNYVIADGEALHLYCRVKATSVEGNRNWYLVVAEGDANWVSGRYLELHRKVKSCARDGIDATATKKAGLFQGASRDDLRIGTLQSGSKLVVRCYTGRRVAGDPTMRRWVFTEKANWVPFSAVRTGKKIPYCWQV